MTMKSSSKLNFNQLYKQGSLYLLLFQFCMNIYLRLKILKDKRVWKIFKNLLGKCKLKKKIVFNH